MRNSINLHAFYLPLQCSVDLLSALSGKPRPEKHGNYSFCFFVFPNEYKTYQFIWDQNEVVLSAQSNPITTSTFSKITNPLDRFRKGRSF